MVHDIDMTVHGIRRRTLLAAALALPLTSVRQAWGQSAGAQNRVTIIGTGGSSGVYYPTGAALCRGFNERMASANVRCLAGVSGGSIDNLRSLRQHQIQFGIVQSDQIFNALTAQGPFEGAPPFRDLRSVLALHWEPFTVVSQRRLGLRGLSDLPGHRVNIGNPGSGQHATFLALMEAMNWTPADFTRLLEREADRQVQTLCDDEADAIVYTVGHPSRAILEATTACDAQLLPVLGPGVDRLLEGRPYYTRTEIAGGLYWRIPQPVPTFGVRAWLMTTADAPDDVVQGMVYGVMERFEAFRAEHLAFNTLTPENVSRAGLAPHHPAAAAALEDALTRALQSPEASENRTPAPPPE